MVDRHSMRGVLPLLFVLLAAAPSAAQSEVVATIDGRPIRANELQLAFFLQQLSESATAEQRRRLLEQLIERQLIRNFLESRRIEISPGLADREVQVMRKVLETKGEDLDKILGKLNLTEESLREMLALPLAWQSYVNQVLTDSRLNEYWIEHRARYDGTRVRAAQIVKVVPRDADQAAWSQAEREVGDIRQQIQAGTITFADAARQRSDSPSGKQGGDLGEFEFHGRVPEAVSIAAFALKPGEVSPPVRSPFGVHLVTVSERLPGELSLEDVRPLILRDLGRQMWSEQVQRARAATNIEILLQP